MEDKTHWLDPERHTILIFQATHEDDDSESSQDVIAAEYWYIRLGWWKYNWLQNLQDNHK